MKLFSDKNTPPPNPTPGGQWRSHAENLARPYAVSRLLYLLAFLLMLLLLGWIVFYWFVKANEEISSQRRQINISYVKSRDYFERHELWLTHLNNTIGNNLQAPVKNDQKSWFIRLPNSDNYIDLPDKSRSLLNRWRASLLYLDASTHTVTALHQPRNLLSQPISPQLWASLETPQTYLSDNPDHIRWFYPQSDPTGRMYVLIPLEPDASVNHHWLGLELRGADVAEFLQLTQQDCCDGYVLQANTGQLLLGSGKQVLQNGATQVPYGFGIHSLQRYDRYLTLKLSANINDWTMTYYVNLFQLLRRSLREEIIAGLLFQLIASVLLLLTVRIVDRRILNPAQQQNERLLENETFNRTMIDTAPVGICVIRHDDASIVLENQLARTLLAEPGQQQDMVTHHPELLRIYRKELGTADNYELALSGDGSRHVLVAFTSSRYQGEAVLLCTLSDISARKQTEAALASAKRASDAASEAKSAFLATMSHEIRTPLYGVLGTLELLSMTELDAEQRQHLETMQASSGTLLQLINDVLDLSKIEAGQMTIECTDFDPIVLIETIVRIYAPSAQRKHLDLYCCIDAELPQQLHGDPLRLQQILGNLLSNALKFTETGKVIVRMDLLKQGKNAVTVNLQVSDSGIGISPADMRRLFEPFTQVGKFTSQRFGGTGLGLSICRRLAKLMGGTIDVVSEQGLGTSFTVTIPLKLGKSEMLNPLPSLANRPVYLHSSVHEVREMLEGWINRCGAQAIPLARPSELRSLTISPGSVLVQIGTPADRYLPPTLAGCVQVNLNNVAEMQDDGRTINIPLYHLRDLLKAIMRLQGQGQPTSANNTTHTKTVHPQHDLRILVAEDHPINQMLLKSQLEMLGATVTVAKDGEEALRVWLEHADTFDLVLTDVNMPRMDGYELARQLRAKGATLPIIGVTANVLREEIERCYEAGMSSHLGKPVSLDGLEKALHEVERQLRQGDRAGGDATEESV